MAVLLGFAGGVALGLGWRGVLDVFHGFLALYFVDVAGVGAVEAALAVAVWTGGESGTAVAVAGIGGLVGAGAPAGLGFLAETLGLGPTMWLLLLAPAALLLGVPRREPVSGC